MLWASQRVAPAFQTQATSQDIATIQLTLDGAPIRRINGGKPASQSISFSAGGQSIKNIPVGEISVRMEAFDAQKKLIGSVFKNRVQITAGKTTKLNLELKLIDEMNTQTHQTEVGHLEVNLNIVDGRKLTQSGAVIPKGSYIKLDTPQASPSSCENGLPVYAPPSAPSSPALPGLPSLNLQTQPGDVRGSSSSFLFKDIDLKADLDQELSGASACKSAASGQTAQTPQPDLTDLIRQVQFLSSELELIKGQYLDLKQQIALTVSAQPATASELPTPAFTSADPQIATVTPDGRIEAKEPGSTQITVSIGGIQTQATVTVEPNTGSSQGPESVTPPISLPNPAQLPDAANGLANLTLDQLLSSGPTPADGGSANTVQLPGLSNPSIQVPSPTDSGPANPFTPPPPSGRLMLSATQVTTGQTLTMSAENLSGEIRSFRWQIRGADVYKTGMSAQVVTTVAAPGSYWASLELLGSDNQWYSASGSPLQLTVQAPPSTGTPALVDPPIVTPPTVTPPTTPPSPVYRYRASSDATQVSHGHFSPDNGQPQLFRLSVAVKGEQGTFALNKLDGSIFNSTEGSMAYLQVGTGEAYGVQHASTPVSTGMRSITLTDTFGKWDANWPKDYYVRLHLKDAKGAWSDTWIGPLKITRE